MNLFRVILAELYKTKWTGAFWLSTVGTVFTSILIALAAIYLPRVSLLLSEEQTMGSWYDWIEFHYSTILPMLLPMYLVILCALSILTENRSNAWNVMYTQPIKRSEIFLAKMKVVFILFMGSHIMFVIIAVLIPFLGNLHFISEPIPTLLIFNLAIGTIISSIGVLSMVFLISYFSRSFVLPLAIGIVGFVISQLLIDAGITNSIFPFSLPVSNSFSLLTEGSPSYFTWITSIVYAIVMSITGCVLADSKNMKRIV